MDFLTDWINEWIKGLLVDGIMGNLSGLFENVNDQIGEIATQVGKHAEELEPRRILPHTAAFRNGCPADCRTGALPLSCAMS